MLVAELRRANARGETMKKPHFFRIGRLGFGDPGPVAFGWSAIVFPFLWWYSERLDRKMLTMLGASWGVEAKPGEPLQSIRNRIRRAMSPERRKP